MARESPGGLEGNSRQAASAYRRPTRDLWTCALRSPFQSGPPTRRRSTALWRPREYRPFGVASLGQSAEPTSTVLTGQQHSAVRCAAVAREGRSPSSTEGIRSRRPRRPCRSRRSSRAEAVASGMPTRPRGIRLAPIVPRRRFFSRGGCHELEWRAWPTPGSMHRVPEGHPRGGTPAGSPLEGRPLRRLLSLVRGQFQVRARHVRRRALKAPHRQSIVVSIRTRVSNAPRPS